MRAFELRATWIQTRFEFRNQLANGEQLLLNLLLPLTALYVVRATGGATQLVTLVMCGAIFASNFTGTAIATAFERRQGVLKALAMTPLGKRGVVVARIGSGVLLSIGQLAVLGSAARFLGLRVDLVTGWWLLVPLLAATSQATAIALAASLRAEAVLAITNGLLVLASLYALLQSGSIWWQIVNPLGLTWRMAESPTVAAIGLLVQTVVALTFAIRSWRWD